jgi:hypothetical protein
LIIFYFRVGLVSAMWCMEYRLYNVWTLHRVYTIPGKSLLILVTDLFQLFYMLNFFNPLAVLPFLPWLLYSCNRDSYPCHLGDSICVCVRVLVRFIVPPNRSDIHFIVLLWYFDLCILVSDHHPSFELELSSIQTISMYCWYFSVDQ